MKMTKMLTMAMLALALTVSPVQADAQKTAVAASKAASAPVLLASMVRPTAPSSSARPAVAGLQALRWLYAVVTSHDSSSCETHRKGVQVNFAVSY